MAVVHIFVGLLLSSTVADAAVQQDALDGSAAVNPIRKVVNMLKAMQTKVLAEGVKEKELYDKFACYCKNGAGELSKSISDAETKVPLLSSDLAEAQAKKQKTDEELKQDKTDRADAKSAIAKATELRDQAAAAFANDKARSTSNIDALSSAITSISQGTGGAFLQTNEAEVLKQLALNQKGLVDEDRQDILAFLSSGGQQDAPNVGLYGKGYAPASGEIVGVLKKIKDDMSQSLEEAEASEANAIASHDQLMTSKTKEIGASSKAIESKSVRSGELALQISQMQNDYEDTERALSEDKKFLRDLDGNCATQAKEWDERSKTRSEEVAAIADTIKLLNDDEALELFKKTLPAASSASFVQLSANQLITRERALSMIRKARENSSHRPQLDFIALAVQRKDAGVKEVVKIVENMIKTLRQEQKEEYDKKDYCGKQFDATDDKKKGLTKTISDLDASIQDATDGIATLKDEVKSLTNSINDLDKSVKEATEQRKSENQEFTDMMSSQSAAKELLRFAIDRLNKFYNPSLVAPSFVAKTGVTSFVEISAHLNQQDAPPPPPPPATFDAYAGNKESGGVLKMIDLLVKDMDKSMLEAKHTEQTSQKDYEQMLKDSADKRAMDSKALTDKNIAVSSMEADIEASKEAKASTGNELMATEKIIASLHSDCDFLLKYFDVRKEARDSEVDALNNAKLVLLGADVSLLQQPSSRNLRKRSDVA